MTEVFSSGRCAKCGCSVGFEDGRRQDFCRCDPACESCGRQFFPGVSDLLCDGCVEEEIEKEFSKEFLDRVSGKQMCLLMRDFARRFG